MKFIHPAAGSYHPARSLKASLMPNITEHRLTVQSIPEGIDPVWHLFVIRCEQQDLLQNHLRNHGIETLTHYPIPPHRSIAYAPATPAGPLPLTDTLADTVLSLPIGPHMEIDSAPRGASVVRDFFEATS